MQLTTKERSYLSSVAKEQFHYWVRGTKDYQSAVSLMEAINNNCQSAYGFRPLNIEVVNEVFLTT